MTRNTPPDLAHTLNANQLIQYWQRDEASTRLGAVPAPRRAGNPAVLLIARYVSLAVIAAIVTTTVWLLRVIGGA